MLLFTKSPLRNIKLPGLIRSAEPIPNSNALFNYDGPTEEPMQLTAMDVICIVYGNMFYKIIYEKYNRSKICRFSKTR